MSIEYFNTRAAAEAWAAEYGGIVSRMTDDGLWIVAKDRGATVARWTRKAGWEVVE